MPSINTAAVNKFLSKRSYVSGFSASKADLDLIAALKSVALPTDSSLPHLSRWLRHINHLIAAKHQFAPDCLDLSKLPLYQEEKKEAKDDDDLFGDDDEADAEAERIKAERLKAYYDKKATKPVVAAKSIVEFDVKPYDTETDLLDLERKIREISMDGLVWAGKKARQEPVAFGIKKLVIECVIEDDKIFTDDLAERILEVSEEQVQSVDIASFNKL